MSKAIFYQLNLFTLDITRKCFIGQGWVPDDDLSAVQEVLSESAKAAESPAPSFVSMIDTLETPPTYHRTNKFTRGFQNLINAYGDSTYRELNPGLYTVVTFPFLFAMMFGDVGHAFIMVCFALYMVLNEKTFDNQRSTNEIWNIFYAGRYIILLMGIFSMYTGFLYNDCFSKRMYLGKSQWLENLESKSDEKYTGAGDYEFDPTLDATQFAYPIGIDPVWGVAKNKIVVENSLKMKLSIIIGVVHMLFGLSLGLFNHLYFKQYYKIFLELIPQITFLTCLFAYLVFMMYFKWFMFSGIEDGHITGNADSMKQGAGCAPLILIFFIDMVLLSKTKPVGEECDAYMYKGQQSVQMVLLFVGLLCIPIMLLGVPCFVNMKHKKKRSKPEKSQFRRYRRRTGERDSMLAAKDQDDEEGESMGELMTHQSVHTIEFVLSTISHTASYLRLWALSLAHAQLSEMLWTMVLAQVGLQKKGVMGFIMTWLMFYAWAVLTLSIMVLMEGLSAFLHTLRLHWVEFMSKFYGGAGHKFIPFCFKGMCFSEEEEKPSAVCGKLTKRQKTG